MWRFGLGPALIIQEAMRLQDGTLCRGLSSRNCPNKRLSEGSFRLQEQSEPCPLPSSSSISSVLDSGPFQIGPQNLIRVLLRRVALTLSYWNSELVLSNVLKEMSISVFFYIYNYLASLVLLVIMET